MDYEIISTGSKGNCVIINDIMVDCGVPFKEIKEKLYDIRYLLLTHIHSDHVRESTINKIKKLFPKILIIGNYEVHQKFGVDIISNEDVKIQTDDYVFYPFRCVHDVLTQGFCWKFKGKEIIYATDTNTMRFAPKRHFDYMFIESNYCEKKLEQVDTKSYGYNVIHGAQRHLSTQQAKTFYYLNRRNDDSQFIELHQSSRFY